MNPSRRSRVWLWLVPVAAFATYASVLAAFGFWEQPRKSALAVVFGNTVLPTGQPSPRLRARLDTALALFNAGLVPRILVSGGIEPNGQDEAAVMAGYLRANGVPDAALLQDPAGIASWETARHTHALLAAGGGVIVVTQWFHVPRAMLAMHRFGIQDVSGAWPRWFEPRDAYSFLREMAGLPAYAVRRVD